MAADYKVNYLLLCDDVRREVSGKEILIGVYNETMIFRAFPASLLTLHFRISLKLSRADFKIMNFAVKGPDGVEMMSTSGPLPPQKITEPVVIDIGTQGASFPRAGVYTVCLGLDRPPEPIGSIILRLPESDDERQRSQIIH